MVYVPYLTVIRHRFYTSLSAWFSEALPVAYNYAAKDLATDDSNYESAFVIIVVLVTTQKLQG